MIPLDWPTLFRLLAVLSLIASNLWFAMECVIEFKAMLKRYRIRRQILEARDEFRRRAAYDTPPPDDSDEPVVNGV